MKTVITGTIHEGDFESLKQVMRDQSSCKRYAYQRIHKDGLKGNDIKVSCKPLYMDKLNQRYIADAVLRAQMINQENSIFGGKKNWKKLISGLISKEEWRDIRDLELYSRGDRTKKGNPNIRILNTPEGYKLRVGLSKPREFVTFKLYIPAKYQEKIDLYNECYDLRIKYKNDKFYVYIGIDLPEIKPIYKLSNGAIGIDANPDGLAVVEVDKQGNLVKHEYVSNQRIQFARHSKRKNDIEDLALQVVNRAILSNKGIVIEDLKFNETKKSSSEDKNKSKKQKKKFNRMRHNFIYSQLLKAIERRAIKDGVEIKKINPAFTSIAGILKYQDMYSLNRHTAAALVIARRGMGIKEKIKVKLTELKKSTVNLEGRSVQIALTKKAYSYFKVLYSIVEVKPPAVTPPCLTPT
jgi:IS605 OrfB family transposase